MKKSSAVSFSSSANLGPGFDTIAVAHTAYYDRITVSSARIEEKEQISIECDGITTDPELNTAGRAVRAMLNSLGVREPIRLTIEKGVPHGLGLGSSGSSAAAAVTAVNSYMNLGLSLNELTEFAMEGERASSGSPHADNVSASIFGGLVFVHSTSPVKVRKIAIDKEFKVLLMIPDIKVAEKTRKAREMLPENITMQDHLTNSRRLSMLIQGFQNGDRSLVGECMYDDIVERARLPMFPFYPEIKKMSLKNGAVSVSISGAGPSIIEFIDSNTDVAKIISESTSFFDRIGVSVTFSKCEVAGGAIVE